MYTKDNPNQRVDDELKHFLNGSTYTKLSEDDKDICDRPLNLEELEAALKKLKTICVQGQMELHQALTKCFGKI